MYWFNWEYDQWGRLRPGRLEAGPEAGCVQAAERLVERDDVPLLGVVGEEGDHLGVVPEHVVDESVEGALRSHLDEDPAPRLVEGAKPLHELDRRGDLAPEDLDHPSRYVGPHRVEAAVDVRHERQGGRLHPEPLEQPHEGLGGRGNDHLSEVRHCDRRARWLGSKG